MKKGNIIKAAAHITGGGLPGNVERVVPQNLAVHLDALNWNIPPVFSWIQTLVCSWCFYYYCQYCSFKFNYHWNFIQIHQCRFEFYIMFTGKHFWEGNVENLQLWCWDGCYCRSCECRINLGGVEVVRSWMQLCGIRLLQRWWVFWFVSLLVIELNFMI